MNPAPSIAILLVVGLGLKALAAAPPAKPPGLSIQKAVEAGRALAEGLRNQKPVEDVHYNGVMKMRDAKGRRTSVPIRFRIKAGVSFWQAEYETRLEPGSEVERLIVVHRDGLPNQYLHASARNGDPARPLPVKEEQSMIPFAGSDFWITDLGLDFLHWQEHRLIKTEMRRGRSCRVLESTNAKPAEGGYARVLSWIDLETDGLLRAEAYDQANQLVKEFAVGSFKKVGGQWQLQDMEIRNEKTDSRTKLEFDLE